MRVKQIWESSPVSKIKLVWDRISFSRLTIAYVVFSILHFIVQIAFQIQAFTINAGAAGFLQSLVEQGNTINGSLPFLDGDKLRLCSWVPSNLDVDVDSCPIVWNGVPGNNTISQTVDASNNVAFGSPMALTSATLNANIITPTVISSFVPQTTAPTPSSSVRAQTITVFVRPTNTPTLQVEEDEEEEEEEELELRSTKEVARAYKRLVPQDPTTIKTSAVGPSGQVTVIMTGMGYKNVEATLDSTCLWALNYPLTTLYNTKREDIVFIAFQFWVLGMSVVAILNESIPHIMASLLTHMMATAWAAFQITHTANFRSDFNRVITRGACDGVALLPNYWEARGNAEIPSLALNVFALLLSLFLTWRLMKLFGWQTFKRVGASLAINRIYKLVLILSITIQLSLFFMVVTVSLWVDQLLNSVMGDLVDFLTLYKATSIVTLILLLPWLITGWFGVRRELRMPMFIFLLLSFLYLGGWSVMFFSTTFRWTFVTWRFFSVMACASVLLTMLCFILGVICRFNFGKGLLRYLNAQETLPDDDGDGYGSSDIEKVDFPSNDKPIPTYAAAFGSGPQVPTSQMYPARIGPRFFNRSAEPFETRSNSPRSSTPSPISPPAAALTRNISGGSNHSNVSVARSETRGSDRDIGRVPSFYSYESGHSRQNSQKRWVIE